MKIKVYTQEWKKSPNQQTRNLHQILNVYSTEQSLILHIYPLANLNISCDPVLAEVLDKNDPRWQVRKKQSDATRQNLIMHFGKKKHCKSFSLHTLVFINFSPPKLDSVKQRKAICNTSPFLNIFTNENAKMHHFHTGGNCKHKINSNCHIHHRDTPEHDDSLFTTPLQS